MSLIEFFFMSSINVCVGEGIIGTYLVMKKVKYILIVVLLTVSTELSYLLPV